MAKQKENNIPLNAFDQALFKWVAPNFLRYERTVAWFVVMGLIDASLVLYAILTDSLTMVAVFLVLPLVLLLEHRKKPVMVDVVISPYGIKFGELRIAFSSIKKFWILHVPPNLDELHLLTENKVHSEVTIPLMGTNPTLIRQYLVTQIVEWEGKGPSFTETIVRLLRLN